MSEATRTTQPLVHSPTDALACLIPLFSASLPEAEDLVHRPRAGLLAEVQRRLRVNRYSLRTERAYLGWIRRFIESSGRRPPRTLVGAEVEAF